MIGVFLGSQNSGKTLSMTYFAKQYYNNGFSILANYKLNFKFTLITKDILKSYVKNKTQLNNSIIILDELYLVADSRGHQSEINKLFSYLLLQSSKRGTHIFATAQVLNTIEKRFRENLSFMSFCERVVYQNGKFLQVTDVNRFVDLPNLYIKNNFLLKKPNYLNSDFNIKTFYIRAKPIYSLYDTKEIYGLE